MYQHRERNSGMKCWWSLGTAGTAHMSNDLSFFDDLYGLSLHSQVKVVTRGQARKQRVQDEQDRTLDAQSGAQPVQVDTLPPPNMTSAEDDGCGEEVAEDVVLDEVAEQGVGGMCQIADGEGGEHVEEPGRVDEELGDDVVVGPVAALDGETGADIPLPDMEGGEADREKLISEQTRDESLRDIRQWAEKGEKGFSLAMGCWSIT